jgi:hypothetical protein
MPTCTGCGLTIVDGVVTLYGAREVEWPMEGAGNSIEERNGLCCDPETGKAWVAPAQRITHASGSYILGTTGDNQSIEPGSGQPAVVELVAIGGFAKMRMVSGNFWRVTRQIDFYKTVAGIETPLATTGLEEIAVFENNSGGVSTSGHVLDASMTHVELDEGDIIRCRATYRFQADSLTANALNVFEFRSPQLHSHAWTKRFTPS